jgi:hypothetical protein
MQNKQFLLDAIKAINTSSLINSAAVIEAINSIPTPEMELEKLIEKRRQQQEITAKNIRSVKNVEKIKAAPVELPKEEAPVKAPLSIEKQYLDLLKGVK